MTATCLCGAVSVTIAAKPDFINDCNCRLCRKSGGAWGYFTPDTVTTAGKTTSFARQDKGTPAVDVHACETCATTTHWVRTEGFKAQYGMNDMVGVNMRLFDPADLEGVRVQYPDGKNWSGEASFDSRRPALTISPEMPW